MEQLFGGEQNCINAKFEYCYTTPVLPWVNQTENNHFIRLSKSVVTRPKDRDLSCRLELLLKIHKIVSKHERPLHQQKNIW